MSAFDNEKLALDIEEELKTKTSLTELEKETIKDVLKNLKIFYEKGNQILTTDNELSESALKILDQVQLISLILVEGITVLNAVPTSTLCQIKFFATLDHETCLKRRNFRSYDPPDIPGDYFRIWILQQQLKSQFYSHLYFF